MTEREIKKAKDMLPKWENGNPPIFTPAQKQLDRELSCREVINSILCYIGPDKLVENQYLADYIKELGEETVSRLCDEQLADFKKAVVKNYVHFDNEGVSYNSVIWADDMIDEILSMVKDKLKKPDDSIGYSLPDGKYHIYISVESYVDIINDNESKDVLYYFIEPNWLSDGAAYPMDNNFVAPFNNFDELLKGCEHCLETFADDREKAKGAIVDKVINDAKEKSELNGSDAGLSKNSNEINME